MTNGISLNISVARIKIVKALEVDKSSLGPEEPSKNASGFVSLWRKKRKMTANRAAVIKKGAQEEEGVADRREEEVEEEKVAKSEPQEGDSISESGSSEGVADGEEEEKQLKTVLMVQTENLTHDPFEKTNEMKVI